MAFYRVSSGGTLTIQEQGYYTSGRTISCKKGDIITVCGNYLPTTPTNLELMFNQVFAVASGYNAHCYIYKATSTTCSLKFTLYESGATVTYAVFT